MMNSKLPIFIYKLVGKPRNISPISFLNVKKSGNDQGVNTYARYCIAPTEDQQTSKQGR